MGLGNLCACAIALYASNRNSSMLFSNANSGINGRAAENIVTKPNWKSISK